MSRTPDGGPATGGSAASGDSWEREAALDTAALRAALACLEPHLGEMVDRFYDRLDEHPGAGAVLARLDAGQAERLRQRQVAHLRLLLSPDVEESAVLARSRQLGRLNAMAGLRMDHYVDVVADHRRDVMRVLARHSTDLDLPRTQSAITDRFMADLQGSVLGYRDDDEEQSRVVTAVQEAAASARTVSDLADGVVRALGGMDGLGLAMFARLTEGEALAYEFAAGPSIAGFFEADRLGAEPVTVTAALPTGQGPMGRAWRTGVVQCCDSLALDPTTVPWRPLAAGLGWRSSASVPLVDATGSTRALLSLQASLTGFFSSSGRTAMLDQVKRVTERALVELERRPALGTAVTGFVERREHLRLLSRGRVEMLFQPQITLRDGRLTKLEALARLRSDDGLLTPADFLPSFGDEELFALFDQGLHQALESLRRWEFDGLTTAVSVNLPVIAMEDARYPTLVRELLAKHDVAPARLTLELLETGFLEPATPGGNRSFDGFKALGVQLAQDDLGSGYSSLLRLRAFAFDAVKIDRSLVGDSAHGPSAALGFIKPITSIARSLGLSVVLEGLEDDGLIEAAVQLGVDEGQGFGIARPMAAQDVVAWERGYRLDPDPCRPRTPLGALAGHVAWEHRVTSQDAGPGALLGSGLAACTLTTYVEGLDDPEVARAHLLLHEEALCGHGEPDHRAAWAALSELVTDRTAG